MSVEMARDADIVAALRDWMALPANERESARAVVGESRRMTLLSFSERMASRAVREKNSEWLLLGLIAQGLDGWAIDERDNLVVLCLFVDACRELPVDVSEVFEQAAALLPAKVATGLRDFLARSPEDQSLEAMGYRRASDAGGFRYERTW